MQTRAPLIATTCLLSSLSLACAQGQAEGDTNATFGSFGTDPDTDDEVGVTEDGEDETGHPEDTGSDTGTPDPTCSDGLQNQDETDADCGGATCSGCDDGLACAQNSDCLSASCVDGVCVPSSCSDGVQNGAETDVDCGGGQCDPCDDGLGCAEAADCVSGVCPGDFCAPPSCGDTVQNGVETDVDCGGPDCTGCEESEMCIENGDCLSQFCSGGTCAPAGCLVDADCADFSGDCTMGVCSPDKVCEATPINDAQSCDDGDLCSTGETCSAGTCGASMPVDCTGMSDDCNLGVCEPETGACGTEPSNEGNACDDMNACTVASVCTAGGCLDPDEPGYVFSEDFANNSAGWTLGTEWEIGAATVSTCASSCPGEDPATDHTATADNGVGGVLIGGCTNQVVHAPYCLTSPAIDTTSLPDSAWLTFWRHLHSDYPSYMTNTVEVFDGSSWVSLWESECCSCINEADWTEVTHDVTAYKNAAFQVRFCHEVGSTGVFTSGSWSIDDVTIAPAVCTP